MSLPSILFQKPGGFWHLKLYQIVYAVMPVCSFVVVELWPLVSQTGYSRLPAYVSDCWIDILMERIAVLSITYDRNFAASIIISSERA